ncbi:hypothetical protein SNEBB_001794 [Seison nebaliae]|nr:hypothetical protein SNEBB_001794 [Seison nebaliae]
MGITKGNTHSSMMKKKVYENLKLKDERFRKFAKKLVDSSFSKNNYRIYSEDDENGERTIYRAVINKTTSRENNLRTLHLLEDDNGNYYYGERWGKKDERDSSIIYTFKNDLAYAKRYFYQKLSEFTDNNSLRYPKDKKGKYYMIDIDMDSLMEEEESKKVSIPKSTLPEEIQDLIKTICNIGPFTSIMKMHNFNEEMMPLGLLSREQILKGYQALKKIANKLSQHHPNSFEELSSDFYSFIPHNFVKDRPIIINNQKQLKTEMDLLKVLYDVNCVDRMLKKDLMGVINPIQRNYELIGCKITLLDDNPKIYEILENYLKLNHSHLHSEYRMELEEIYQIERENDPKFVSKGNVKLLWHGSNWSNIASILGNGLTLPTEETPNTNLMFGKGIYFADVSSKSANYSIEEGENIGFLLLCHVSLGKEFQTYNADCNAENKVKKANCDSLGAIGKFSPEITTHRVIKYGDTSITVPIGRCVEIQNGDNCVLKFNEYVVYDERQIRIRFIMKVKYIGKSVSTTSR